MNSKSKYQFNIKAGWGKKIINILLTSLGTYLFITYGLDISYCAEPLPEVEQPKLEPNIPWGGTSKTVKALKIGAALVYLVTAVYGVPVSDQVPFVLVMVTGYIEAVYNGEE